MKQFFKEISGMVLICFIALILLVGAAIVGLSLGWSLLFATTAICAAVLSLRE